MGGLVWWGWDTTIAELHQWLGIIRLRERRAQRTNSGRPTSWVGYTWLPPHLLPPFIPCFVYLLWWSFFLRCNFFYWYPIYLSLECWSSPSHKLRIIWPKSYTLKYFVVVMISCIVKFLLLLDLASFGSLMLLFFPVIACNICLPARNWSTVGLTPPASYKSPGYGHRLCSG